MFKCVFLSLVLANFLLPFLWQFSMHLSILCILSLFSISVSFIIIMGCAVSTHTGCWMHVEVGAQLHGVGSLHPPLCGLQAWAVSTLNYWASCWPGFVSDCISRCHGHSITSHLILFLLVQHFINLSWHSFFCLIESIDVFHRNDVDSLIFFYLQTLFKNLNLISRKHEVFSHVTDFFFNHMAFFLFRFLTLSSLLLTFSSMSGLNSRTCSHSLSGH